MYRLLALLVLVLNQAGGASAVAHITKQTGLLNQKPKQEGLTTSTLALAGVPLGDVSGISAGYNHTCALTAAGGVKCWGRNNYGQLGDGTTVERRLPVDVTGLESGVIALAAGGGHTCALLAGGGVKCWGNNDDGQLGDSTTTDRHAPTSVSGLGGSAVALAAGGFHTCALLVGGAVKCWGDNHYGQLSDGTTVDRHAPVDVIGLASEAIALELGDEYTCALTVGGGVKCWGHNSSGQLGDGTNQDRHTPTDVSGLASGVLALAAGYYHTCASMVNGGAKCWGRNFDGQLGDGTTADHLLPVDVSELAGSVTALAAGYSHTCALTAEGGVKCWGWSSSGQLGDGSIAFRLTPVDVTGLSSGVSALTSGWDRTCALLTGGGVKCWGDDFHGQLGDGMFPMRSNPLLVSDLPDDPIALTGGDFHTCALNAGGGVACWGGNEEGQLGDGTRLSRLTPVVVIGLESGVIAVEAGKWHNCALLAGGGVKCWGSNYFGQLGNGTTEDRLTPVDVIGLQSGVTSLVAGWGHTCALLVGGGVRCWGDNEFGQLGDGTTGERHVPVDVTGIASGALSLKAGLFHTCALMTGGGIKCWGFNWSGQLGDGTYDDHPAPVDVSGMGSGVTSIETGGAHTCAVLVDGGVKCWGLNEYGQLGDDTLEDRHVPVDVSGLVGSVISLAAGENYTCAMLLGGRVQCWGDNEAAQLGDGTTLNRLTPVDVSGLAGGVIALMTGDEHACVLFASRHARCWGSNYYGQLGLGSAGRATTPVDVLTSVSPRLELNYTSGQPGSLFTLTGDSFPPSSQATLEVNGNLLTTHLPVNVTGGFVVFLDTALAGTGYYQVIVNGGASAEALFGLFAQAPIRALEGGGTMFAVPADIALALQVTHLPLLVR
jgi:alpha-tubulin suppressor-like RCC1 family protein